MTALDDLLAACDSLDGDTHYAVKTRALATALRAWAPTVTVPTPTPTLLHVDTWTYDDASYSAGWTTPAAFVQEYATYVEALNDDGKAVNDLHAAAFRYFDPLRIYFDSSGSSVPIIGHDSESWWLHKPGTTATLANRIVLSWNGTTHAYVLNLTNTAVVAWLAAYAKQHYAAFDGLRFDDFAGTLAQGLYASTGAQKTSLEIGDDAGWRAGLEALIAAVAPSWRLVVNSFTANEWSPNSLWLLDEPGVIGGVMEQVPLGGNQLIAASRFANMLDLCAAVTHRPTGYMTLMSNGIDRTVARWRLLHAASVLLSWQPGRIVSWTDYAREAQLQVYPEACIVPSQPVQTMGAPNSAFAGDGKLATSGGHLDLQVAPNVYRREFHTSTYNGAPFGPLAVIVNAGTTAIPIVPGWLTGTYNRTVTLSGLTMEAGGAVTTTAGTPSTLPAQSAATMVAA